MRDYTLDRNEETTNRQYVINTYKKHDTADIALLGSRYAVQDHSRSLMLVPAESNKEVDSLP